MKAEDIDLWTDALLLKIHAITGWTLPEETMLVVLADQFRKKIQESYAHVNPDEFEYAFRNFGTTVQDWGKAMNLALIDQVMIPYLSRRAELSKIEEQQEPAEEVKMPEADMGDIAMEDWCKELKERIQAGTADIAFMPVMVYDWLEKKDRIVADKALKKEHLRKAIDQWQAKLVSEAETDGQNARTRLSDFLAQKEAKLFKGELAEQLRILAKKNILFDFIRNEYEPK